jgi:hypothetical protein
MRYCNHCHRITTGNPLFCNFCGRSYNLKLCPHRHPNPRSAEICSQCGSRDLSTPQPRRSLFVQPLLVVLSALPGIALLVLSLLFLAGLVEALTSNLQLLYQATLFGLMLVFLWYLYMQLPGFLRRLLARLFRRSHSRDHHEH